MVRPEECIFASTEGDCDALSHSEPRELRSGVLVQMRLGRGKELEIFLNRGEIFW